jgi:hypothetical protein
MMHVLNNAQIINEVLGSVNGMDEGQFSEYWCSTEYITPNGGSPLGFGTFVYFATLEILTNAKTPVLKVRAMRRF